MRLPLESAAATDITHGPVCEPLYAGLATITKLFAAVAEVIVNCADDDVPPPGAGVVTFTDTVPDDDSFALGMTAVSCVDETKVVINGWPLKPTTDTLAKLVPVTVIVVSDEPDETNDGDIVLSTGNG